MIKRCFTVLCLILAACSVLTLAACRNGEGDITTAPESSGEPGVTADPDAVPGQEYILRAEDGACAAHSALVADPNVVTAEVDGDGNIKLTSVNMGSTDITVKNTYGEEFTIAANVDTKYMITVSGGYTKPENSANVLDFGAKPNDTGSDTSAIQKAIDSLPGGGTVYIPRGIYIISRIQLKEGVHLKLEGLLDDYTATYVDAGVSKALNQRRLAVLRTDKSGDMFINHARGDYGRNGCSNFSVSGGMLDMEGKVRCFIWCCAENVLLENVIMKDCPNNHAIQITGSRNVTIRNCMFAGYNYTTNNTTAEVVQIEPTTPGAIGSSNPASVFDKGEYNFSANVEISGCYFGRSDEYDAPTFAIGHHSQVNDSAVTGCRITGNVFDNCRCSAIRYIAYSDVLISGNRFVSDRDNSVSADALPSMIYFYVNNKDVSVPAKTLSGSSVTAFYARAYACRGCINTAIENNEFVFGAKTGTKLAVNATSNHILYDAMYDSGSYYTSWYTEPARIYVGYKLTMNRVDGLILKNNRITVDAASASNGLFYNFTYVQGLDISGNTVEGKSFTAAAELDGVSVPNARFFSCTSSDENGRRRVIFASSASGRAVILTGSASGDIRLYCTVAAQTKITIEAEGGKLELSLDDGNNVTVKPVPDAGKTFREYTVTDGTLTQNGDKSEFRTALTVTAVFE